MMRHTRNILILMLFLGISGISYGQSEGELDRFAALSMDKNNVVSLYPNPAIDYVQVKIENSELQEPTITLYNILGNEVEVTLKEQEDDTYLVDISSLPAGYYFLALRDEKTYFRETYKFVKR